MLGGACVSKVDLDAEMLLDSILGTMIEDFKLGPRGRQTRNQRQNGILTGHSNQDEGLVKRMVVGGGVEEERERRGRRALYTLGHVNNTSRRDVNVNTEERVLLFSLYTLLGSSYL